MSILTFYLKLSPSTVFRRLVHGSMFLVGGAAIASSLLWTLSCMPVSLHWNLVAIITGTFNDRCKRLWDVQYACVGLNMVTDLWVWALPIPMILSTSSYI